MELVETEADISSVLVFSFTGYQNREVSFPVAAAGPVTIEMKVDLDGATYFYVEEPSIFQQL